MVIRFFKIRIKLNVIRFRRRQKRNHFLFYVTDFPIDVCKCHVLFINLQMQKSFIDIHGTCSRGSTGRATIKTD